MQYPDLVSCQEDLGQVVEYGIRWVLDNCYATY